MNILESQAVEGFCSSLVEWMIEQGFMLEPASPAHEEAVAVFVRDDITVTITTRPTAGGKP